MTVWGAHELTTRQLSKAFHGHHVDNFSRDTAQLYWCGMSPHEDVLSPALRNAAVARLGLSRAAEPSEQRLFALYAAWCRSVPFDNVRKMLALRSTAATLPAIAANDFFEGWLAHGTGATCWPSSNALFALLIADGFRARRIAGSMRDSGVVNHGSIKVRLGDRDWLVDSSMLLGEPLPLDSAQYRRDDLFGAEVEPVDGTHVVWFEVPPHVNGYPCRLLVDDVDHAYYVDRYAESRERSAFNARLYARRNRDGGTVVLRGTTRFVRESTGVTQSELDRDGVMQALVQDIGIARDVVRAWEESGALEATFEPFSGPPPPPIGSVPPSRRGPTDTQELQQLPGDSAQMTGTAQGTAHRDRASNRSQGQGERSADSQL